MKNIIRYILGRFSDESLKSELRRRGYATDISVKFVQGDEEHEFSAIGKKWGDDEI